MNIIKDANIINNNNDNINISELNEKKIIGLYFSASWCPPCCKFTPILSTLYEDMLEYYDDIEIIFISWDENNEDFNNYRNKMSFLALSFNNQNIKDKLNEEYNITQIPTLIFINLLDNSIINNGKEIIQNSNGNIEYVRNKLNI